MKKTLSILLSILMLCSVFSAFNAYAATSGSCGDSATWELKNGTLTITGTGLITSNPWKENASQIKNLVVEEGITGLGSDTNAIFGMLTELKTVSLPTTFKKLSTATFYGDEKLERIVIPEGVKTIYGFSFYCCTALKEAVIPNSVTTIGQYAFYECTSLEKIDLPEKLIHIHSRAFFNCDSAKGSVTINDKMEILYYAFSDCDSLTDVYIINSVGREKKHNTIFRDCKSLKTVHFVGEMPKFNDYIYHMFRGCDKLTNVDISEGIETISGLANFSKLSSVTLPKSAKKIDDVAFVGCENLKSVKIQGKLDEIGAGAFRNCALNSVKIPYGVDKIGEYAIGYNKADDSDEYTPIKNFKIYGKKCKALTSYCKDNGFKFVDMYDVKNAKAEGVSSKTYTGKSIKPEISVKLAGVTLTEGTDYTVKYSNNTKVGTAKVTITGKGKYKGTLTKTFKINPKPTELTKLTPKSKSFKAYWKKNKSQTSGYQIQYSVYKSFKNAKKVTVKGYKTGARTVKDLKSKKKYFVRVRAYKVVDGKKYYSKWSESLKVTTK